VKLHLSLKFFVKLHFVNPAAGLPVGCTQTGSGKCARCPIQVTADTKYHNNLMNYQYVMKLPCSARNNNTVLHKACIQ